MEQREVKRIVVCGKQGVGKSWETIRMMLEAAQGKPGVPPRKGLIFDVNDEFGDFPFVNGRMSIRAISLKDITLFTVNNRYEVRRIRPYFDDGRVMTSNDKAAVLEQILEQFNNGILLVEDPNTYVSDSIPADIIGKLVSTRHRSTDMILHFQNIGRAGHPKIVGNTSMIRLHKTNDSVSRHKNKFEEKTELLQIAEYIINKKYNEGNKRFFLWVDIDDSKIRGEYTLQEATLAVHEYISENFNTIVRPYLLKRDIKTGNKLYKDEAVALEIARKEMMMTYFPFQTN